MYRSGLLHGGATSKPFDDSVDLDLSPTQACIGVELFWYDEYLFALRFIYKGQDRSASPIFHGDSSERDPPLKTGKFMLSAGEKINKVTWYAGTHDWKYNNKLIRFVLGIQFETTNGRISPLYGSNGGDEHSESFKGYTFGYAKGTSVTLIDQLQIVWIKESESRGSSDQIYSTSNLLDFLLV